MALTAMVTLGIRELSNTLADPFGSDETDIPVLDYVAKWHAEFDNLLEFVPPGFEKAETSTTSEARL
jgi:predicted membrane chloride channel (bestrophin family)